MFDKCEMRWKSTFLLLLIALAMFAATRIFFNPLRRSDAEVRAWLCSITPLGSNRNEVQAIVDARGWSDKRYQKTVPSPAKKPFLGGEIGGYQGMPWYVFVSAFWEFDEDNRLKNIQIRHIIDSP